MPEARRVSFREPSPFLVEFAGTWHPSDLSDWLSLDVVTAGTTRYEVRTPPGTLAHLEVRCPSGLFACSGIGASMIGNLCVVAPRSEVVQLDVGCGPGGSVVFAGAARGSATACSRWIRVLSP